jgi:ABC-type Fe3+-hydroxamate transport system substrate-binding protein
MHHKKYIDQMGRRVDIGLPVSRIVSIVPSQTELLVDLGLADKIVGVTRFCIHPKDLRSKTVNVGGTKQLHLDRIRALKPDLIIGNKEENERCDIEALETEIPVWMSDIVTVSDALEMIHQLGEITATETKAAAIIQQITIDFEELKQFANQFPPKKVAYLIWKDPMMCAGKGTFIDEMLQLIQLENVLQKDRYPELNERVEEPEVILLSSEPYPFKEKHLKDLQTEFPNAKILLVDGEIFSWYGSRLLHAKKAMMEILEAIHQS